MTNGETWGLYARVSSERQADDGLSIEAQLAALRTFASQRGWNAREFVDAGKSAWTENLDKRPQFKAMLDAARAGELKGIAVTHLDRFSRKLIVTLQVLGELGHLGVGFVSLENAAFDFSRPADRLLLAVLGAFAEYYSAELSRKIKRGLETRASKGLHVGSVPFGYCNGRCVDCRSKAETAERCERWGVLGKDAPLMLHPTDAEGVRLAFETYRTGNASYNDIADILNAAGYRSRTTRGRVLWNKHSVAELLRNETYTGVVVIKGKRIEGHHPAIISREVFEQVAAMRRKRFRHQTTYNRKYRVYLFIGILRCAKCGRVMRADARGKGQRLCYHCTSRELKHTCTASNVLVYEDQLAPQFERIVAQFRLPPDWQARVSELVNGNGKRAQRELDRRALTERLARIKKQFEWGDLTEQEYRAKRDEIQSALAACNPPSVQVIINAAEYLQNIAQIWDAATPAERRDIVRAVFEEIVCDPDTRRLIALRPKLAFVPILRQVQGLVEKGGIFEI